MSNPEDPRAPRLLGLVDEAAKAGTVSGHFAAVGRAIQQTLNDRNSGTLADSLQLSENE